MNKRWGLMSADGLLLLQPVYEAIGEFDRFGLAIMKFDGKVGVLDTEGKVIVKPAYDDIKVLDEHIISANSGGLWQIVNYQGKVLLDEGYERVEVWGKKYVAYRSNNTWGIIQLNGEPLIPNQFDAIEMIDDNVFQTKKDDQFGLYNIQGQELLAPVADAIFPVSNRHFLMTKDNLFGLINIEGEELLPIEYKSIREMGKNHLAIRKKGQQALFDLSCEAIIHQGQAEVYQPLNDQWVLLVQNGKTGLIDQNGAFVIPVKYEEIQLWSSSIFRVKDRGAWGLVTDTGEEIVPPIYQYIGAPSYDASLIRQNNLMGLLNLKGELIMPCDYDRIEYNEKEARGFSADGLEVVSMTQTGETPQVTQFKNHFTITIGKRSKKRNPSKIIENDFLLADYEWFYSVKVKKWGLRKRSDGSLRIKPKFDWIRVEKELGFSVVGMDETNYQDFEFTSFRFERAYRLVNNKVGRLIGDAVFLDINLDDFKNDHPLARCILKGGRHGLIDKSGSLKVKDYAFIGPFRDGLARFSSRGHLSGTSKLTELAMQPLKSYLDKMLSPSLRVDYTRYDQSFEKDAQLICEDCKWGYLNEKGELSIGMNYDYVKDFVNGVGLVHKKDKWGAIDDTEKELILCEYDNIEFLENTDNKMLKVTKNSQKYGLIDTLGQVRVDYAFDEIGFLSEGRLAVKRNGLWGFVNLRGQEIIPCRFRRVNPFHEGLATVKLSNAWGVIDKQGDVVLDFKFSKIGNFVDGLTWANQGYRIGFMNAKGEFVIPAKFQKAFDFQHGVARVVVKGKYGLINTAGKYVMRPTFDKIQSFNEQGSAVAQKSVPHIKYSLIDVKGNVLTHKNFQQIFDFHEGLALVRHRNEYGYINAKGQLVISAKYSKAGDFSEGRAWVQNNNVCGYVNVDGQEVIDLEYSRCQDFIEGKAVVYRGYRQGGIIDQNGNYIIEPGINRLYGFQDGRGLVRDQSWRFYYITEDSKLAQGYYDQAGQFKHGIALVQSNGKWGIINQQGASIVPPKYDKIEEFVDGFAKVRIKRFTGLSNLSGEFLLQPKFEYVSYAGNGLFRVEKGDKLGYFDQSGNWVWQLQE